MQNPGEMRKFEDVTQWLRETSGAHLDGVSLEEFRKRIGQAVVDGERTSGVLPQVGDHWPYFFFFFHPTSFSSLTAQCCHRWGPRACAAERRARESRSSNELSGSTVLGCTRWYASSVSIGTMVVGAADVFLVSWYGQNTMIN